MSKHHTPASAEKLEHTIENQMVWLEKQSAQTLDAFVKRAQELSQKHKEDTLKRLRQEFDQWCTRDGVSFKDVVNYGRKKRGPKKNGSAP